jgi:hypothetical protein
VIHMCPLLLIVEHHHPTVVSMGCDPGARACGRPATVICS